MVKVEVKIPKILDKLSDSQTYLEATKLGAFEVSNYLRTEHFPEKNANEPNKLGAKRTNFWTDVGRSVLQPFVKGLSVIVRINDFRFAQKLYGGVIKAKRVKFLTIPISKQAYDKRVSVFEQETGKRLFRMPSIRFTRPFTISPINWPTAIASGDSITSLNLALKPSTKSPMALKIKSQN